jgi:hypothetical protein
VNGDMCNFLKILHWPNCARKNFGCVTDTRKNSEIVSIKSSQDRMARKFPSQ